MKKNFLYVFAVGVVIGLISTISFAQKGKTTTSVKDLYLISAKAGGVNYVEGKVTVAVKNKRNGLLLKGDNLAAGEIVNTGTDGRAEILLNPGSFVRLAENSSFEFANTSLDDLQLKLNSGSAMFEVFADNQLKITVAAPKANFYIVKSGVYRVDVLNDGTGKIEVWNGKAQIGKGQIAEIKGGRAATVNGSQVAIEKFDRRDKDALEIWSKTRGKELAKLNARLQNQALTGSLINSFNRQRWSLYDTFGLWVFNPSYGSYCFLPFGYGWNSPYGYSFGRDIWYYRLPNVIYNQPPPPTGNNSIGRLEPNRGKAGSVSQNPREDSGQIAPPFRRIQRDIGRSPVEQDTNPTVFQQIQPTPVVIIPQTIQPERKKGN
jgi:hypothetical protein